MRRNIVSVGLAMILFGAVLAFLGPWREIVLVPELSSQELTISDEELFYIGSDGYVTYSAELGSNSTTDVYFKVYYGTIRFFVVDDENFQEWKTSKYSTTALAEYEDTKTEKFTLQFETGGTYHFVFDNTGREKTKKVYFDASASWVETELTETVRENNTPVYAGIATAVLGGVVVFIGLRIQGEKRSRYDEIRELWLGKGS